MAKTHYVIAPKRDDDDVIRLKNVSENTAKYAFLQQMRKVKQQDKAHGDVGFNKRILRKQPEKRSKACSNCTCFEASTEVPFVTRRYSAFLHTAVDTCDARSVFGQFEVHPVTARFAMERQNMRSQLKLASMHDIQGDA